MSRYVNITSASTTALAGKANYSTNTALNRRGSNSATINKICIVNYGTVDVTSSVYLNAVLVARNVNQTNATTNKIIFDEDVIISEADQIKVGDVCINSNDTIHGTVVSINPSQKSVTISASVDITDNEVLYFRAPEEKLYIVKTVVPVGANLALYDSFSFNVNRYTLTIKPSVASGTPNLTIIIN